MSHQLARIAMSFGGCAVLGPRQHLERPSWVNGRPSRSLFEARERLRRCKALSAHTPINTKAEAARETWASPVPSFFEVQTFNTPGQMAAVVFARVARLQVGPFQAVIR